MDANNIDWDADIFVINYDVLKYWVKFLTKNVSLKMIIYDESHYLKNIHAGRTKAAYQLSYVRSKLFMSGTLALNKSIELYSPLSLLRPKAFFNYNQFIIRYCAAAQGPFFRPNRSINSVELHRKINKYLFRRTKEELLPELPPKRYGLVMVDVTNRSEYNKAENEFLEWLIEKKGEKKAKQAIVAQKITQITYLTTLVGEGIVGPAIDYIKEFLSSSDQKLVIFGIHRKVLQGVEEVFADISVRVDGTLDASKKAKAVDKFQNDPKIRLFLGNIQAAGVGITLTASSEVLFIEFPWTPGLLDQAIDRTHRIGQSKTVNITYLVARNTIMERMVKALDSKRKVLSQLLDGKDTVDSDTLINSLISEYEAKASLRPKK
jgi:SWI/SNF-related matrix-associated actin-dependent regulator 1 of chromatin subfamily A